MITTAYTSHARMRMQQRGISEIQIRLIEEFGRCIDQKGGTQRYYVPRETIAELRRAVDTLDGVHLVSTDAGQAITVFHESRRLRRA